MKSNKELTQEIMKKIHKREAARLQFRKHVRRVFAFAIIFLFLVPTSVLYMTNEKFNHERPLSFPFEEELPFDSDDDPANTMEQRDPTKPFEFVSVM
jgi:hypothetical protein